jgi:hypothetical protein
MVLTFVASEVDDNAATCTVQGPTTGIARYPLAVEPFFGICHRLVNEYDVPASVPDLDEAPHVTDEHP